MEHAVHLAAGHFIKGIAPTSAQALIKKVKQAVQSGNIDDVDLDDIDIHRYDGDDGHGEDLDESDVDFEVGDAVGKALALVMQANIFHHSL